MTVVVIEQPSYVPWIGYFDLIRRSETWVWYDEVQYTKRDWRNRNSVALDVPEWMTIPVLTKGRFTQPIRDVEIDYSQAWIRQHLGTLRRCYGRAPYFEPMYSLVEDELERRDWRLADLTIRLNEKICAALGLAPQFMRSSEIPKGEDDRGLRLIEICQYVGGSSYLSGPAAKAYIDTETFRSVNLELRYMTYSYRPYPRGDRPFLPNLSILDPLAWLGARGTMDLLKSSAVEA